MARYLPETKQDFLNIKGIGEKKYKQFGEQINAILTQWMKDNPKEDKAIQINQDHFKQPNEKNELPSHRETYKLIKSGKQIKDIASMNDLTEQTIENNLINCYKDRYS